MITGPDSVSLPGPANPNRSAGHKSLMNSSGAIILAGGQSSRMGTNKASLVLDGQLMLERLAQAVSPLAGQIILMLSAAQPVPPVSSYLADRIDIGRDTRPAQGPLQGISDALPLLRPEIKNLFVLSCDLPFLSTAVLRQMPRLLTSEVDGVCAEVNGRVNPLLALYRRRLVSEVVRPAAAGRSCMVLIDGHRIARLAPPADAPLAFNGINTPADYEAALQQLISPDH